MAVPETKPTSTTIPSTMAKPNQENSVARQKTSEAYSGSILPFGKKKLVTVDDLKKILRSKEKKPKKNKHEKQGKESSQKETKWKYPALKRDGHLLAELENAHGTQFIRGQSRLNAREMRLNGQPEKIKFHGSKLTHGESGPKTPGTEKENIAKKLFHGTPRGNIQNKFLNSPDPIKEENDKGVLFK